MHQCAVLISQMDIASFAPVPLALRPACVPTSNGVCFRGCVGLRTEGPTRQRSRATALVLCTLALARSQYTLIASTSSWTGKWEERQAVAKNAILNSAIIHRRLVVIRLLLQYLPGDSSHRPAKRDRALRTMSVRGTRPSWNADYRTMRGRLSPTVRVLILGDVESRRAAPPYSGRSNHWLSH